MKLDNRNSIDESACACNYIDNIVLMNHEMH